MATVSDQATEQGSGAPGVSRIALVFPAVAAVWVLTVVVQAIVLVTGGTEGADPGPGFLPLVLGVPTLLGLLATIGAGLRRPAPAAAGAPLAAPVVRLGVLVAAVAPAIGWIGVGPAVLVLLLGCLRLEGAGWTRSLVTGAVLAAGLYVVFVVLLQVRVDLLPTY